MRYWLPLLSFTYAVALVSSAAPGQRRCWLSSGAYSTLSMYKKVPQLASVCRRHRERTACMDWRRSLSVVVILYFQKVHICVWRRSRALRT